ncbi:hypothetical protein BDN71DRAFT_1456610 [Pleurotus eryngii]|uniref:F-box domain-containing protein n=1 Tax=Pleurotus eryngii TaxID=5323 RepID=A0A9P5ZJU2_PLEER|nr:hypothetical protein BDN71DRAFT_1456610 [Pleurotus eryngii]
MVDIHRFSRSTDAGRLPMEVIFKMFRKCRPAELLILRATCKRFHQLLEDHEVYWTRARLSFWPALPPLPPSFSERRYAALVFSGGSCMVCGQWTYTLPTSFSLRLFICEWNFSNCRSRYKHSTLQAISSLKNPKFKLPKGETEALVKRLQKFLVYDDAPNRQPIGRRVYLSQDIRNAKNAYMAATKDKSHQELLKIWKAQEAFQAPFMAACVALRNWSDRFNAVMKQSHKDNMQILRKIASAEKMTLQSLLCSSIIQRHHDLHMLNNETFSSNVWPIIRSSVLGELCNIRQIKTVREAKGAHPSEALRCSRCPRKQHVYNLSGILNHLVGKHMGDREQTLEGHL